MSAPALRGEDLFFSARTRCFRCHGGFAFTETVDYVGKGLPGIEFHNTGLQQPRPRWRLSGPQHRRPRGHAATRGHGPLQAAVAAQHRPDRALYARRHPAHADRRGAPLRGGWTHHRRRCEQGRGAADPQKSEFVTGFTLTDEERSDLVAFLESLTDQAFISDSASPIRGRRSEADDNDYQRLNGQRRRSARSLVTSAPSRTAACATISRPSDTPAGGRADRGGRAIPRARYGGGGPAARFPPACRCRALRRRTLQTLARNRDAVMAIGVSWAAVAVTVR